MVKNKDETFPIMFYIQSSIIKSFEHEIIICKTCKKHVLFEIMNLNHIKSDAKMWTWKKIIATNLIYLLVVYLEECM